MKIKVPGNEAAGADILWMNHTGLWKVFWKKNNVNAIQHPFSPPLYSPPLWIIVPVTWRFQIMGTNQLFVSESMSVRIQRSYRYSVCMFESTVYLWTYRQMYVWNVGCKCSRPHAFTHCKSEESQRQGKDVSGRFPRRGAALENLT